ncbi:hypothetical protein COLO4_38540 [Corchorus olitorius]|uniref:Uncharacterized protein n=1 Tax=Corchorus olitorius TaxID=93759 RepID=A0A1R3FUE6_9ROSI|nr:hypothetical protein COLO4_38540 [Corchorus olitorius]
MFANKSRSRVMDLKNTLTSTKRGTKSVSEYLQFMKHIAAEIKLTGANVEEDDLVLYILNGLGSDFREISANIRARDTSIGFDELHDKLTSYELFLKQESTQNHAAISVPTANFTWQMPSNKSFRSRSRQNGTNRHSNGNSRKASNDDGSNTGNRLPSSISSSAPSSSSPLPAASCGLAPSHEVLQSSLPSSPTTHELSNPIS